jgi:flagellar biosynthetic protein FliR
MTILIFLRLDVHHWVLRALGSSFLYLPLGGPSLHGGIAESLLHLAASIWSIGLQIAAPVLVATMITDVALGFLTKASPHLPALFLGLSLKSMLGFALLGASVALWPNLLTRQFSAALHWSDALLRMAK